MRPVERGPAPHDDAGNAIAFAEYEHARPHLIQRMGDYCSYYEMPLAAALAVEHIRCKDRCPEYEREWVNFLLACPSCNSTKGTLVATAEDVERYVWPHQDRTFDLFLYGAGGTVELALVGEAQLAARASNTEQMVGLTRRPGAGLTSTQVKSGSDNRYKKRSEAWDEAVDAWRDLQEHDSPDVRKWILKTARARGFWSVWMTVFCADEQMQAALCGEAFPGTAKGRVHPLPAHVRSRTIQSNERA